MQRSSLCAPQQLFTTSYNTIALPLPPQQERAIPVYSHFGRVVKVHLVGEQSLVSSPHRVIVTRWTPILGRGKPRIPVQVRVRVPFFFSFLSLSLPVRFETLRHALVATMTGW